MVSGKVTQVDNLLRALKPGKCETGTVKVGCQYWISFFF